MNEWNQDKWSSRLAGSKGIQEDIVEKLKNSNHEDLEKISSWLTDDESYRLEEFRKTVKLHDVYRKESFKEIFPEIYAWLF